MVSQAIWRGTGTDVCSRPLPGRTSENSIDGCAVQFSVNNVAAPGFYPIAGSLYFGADDTLVRINGSTGVVVFRPSTTR